MATLTYNPKDMEDNIGPKEQLRPIVQAYMALSEHIENCHKVLGNLEDRLAPILGPDFPCQAKEEVPTTESSKMAMSIHGECSKLSVLIDRINRLEKRIEI